MAVPLVSVVVCTRDRASDLDRCLRSVLGGTYSRLEILVVDQSRDEAGQEVVTALADSRVRYLRRPATGKTLALNDAVGEASGELVAFIDDDCTAPADWAANIVEAFSADAELALLVGSVVAAAHDSRRGFIPTFEPPRRLVGREIFTFQSNPMGANMAARRTTFHRAGGFDPVLGSGGPLHSSYDLGYCYRLYALGLQVVADPSVRVVHHGFRNWAEGRILVKGYAIGTAAAYMKYVRLGDWRAAVLLLLNILRYVGRSFRQLVRRRRPLHVRAIWYRLVGIVSSFSYEVDRTTLCYVRPAQPAPPVMSSRPAGLAQPPFVE